jgi:uncharacterized protein YrzB (UPF0473 family)
MEKESDGTLITLLDEEGKEEQFEHLATIEHEGSSYVALVPYYENPEDLIEDDGELVILKIIADEDGEEVLVAIEDEKEFNIVADKFEEILEDEFEIKDEDSEPDDEE